MSKKKIFRCQECGYETVIYEGRGFMGQHIEAMACPDCRNIVPLVVGGVIGDAAPSFNSLVGRLCLRCGSDRIHKWDMHTCPKCGGKMQPSGEEEFWTQYFKLVFQSKPSYGVGTELVRSGSSYDILWGGLQKLKYYMMEKIIVDVAWCDRNYGGSLGSNVPGAVVFTAPTFEALQKEAKESLEFHVEGLVENGEDVPEWLKNGDYEFEYNIIR